MEGWSQKYLGQELLSFTDSFYFLNSPESNFLPLRFCLPWFPLVLGPFWIMLCLILWIITGFESLCSLGVLWILDSLSGILLSGLFDSSWIQSLEVAKLERTNCCQNNPHRRHDLCRMRTSVRYASKRSTNSTHITAKVSFSRLFLLFSLFPLSSNLYLFLLPLLLSRMRV